MSDFKKCPVCENTEIPVGAERCFACGYKFPAVKQPGPAPAPKPGPQPGPAPAPKPGPQPGPAPAPQPGPAPAPKPGPQPGPAPTPQPGPAPRPNPGPQPGPVPTPKKKNPLPIILIVLLCLGLFIGVGVGVGSAVFKKLKNNNSSTEPVVADATQDAIDYIVAEYVGPDIVVGNTYDKADVHVTAYHESGMDEIIDMGFWDADRYDVTDEGSNTFTVEYLGYTTEFAVNGYIEEVEEEVEETAICEHCGVEIYPNRRWSAWVQNDDGSDYVDSDGNKKAADKDYNYDEHCFKLIKGDYTWDEAEAACEAAGGHLLTITSYDEMTRVENFLNGQNVNNAIIWLGFYSIVDENGTIVATWGVNDEGPGVNNFAKYDDGRKPEPSGGFDVNTNQPEDKMCMYRKPEWTSNPGYEWVWNDVPADITQYYGGNLYYICEWDHIPVE